MNPPTPALYILLTLILCAAIHAQTPSPSSTTAPTSSATPTAPTTNSANPTNPPADSLFASAQAAAGQAKYDQAQTLFANFVARHPSDPRAPLALYLRGDCLYRIKNKERETNEIWHQIINTYPDCPYAPAALERLAQHADRRRDQREAQALRDKLLAKYPDSSYALNIISARGQAALQAARYAEAVTIYEKIPASKLNAKYRGELAVARAFLDMAKNPEALLEAGEKQLLASDPATAKVLYSTYIEKFPHRPRVVEARTRLGWSLYVTGKKEDIERAVALWKPIAASTRPQDKEWVEESQWHLVQYLAGPADKWREAIAQCERIAKSSAAGSFRLEQALYSKAWLYWAKQEWKPALAGFDALIAAFPEKASHPPILHYMEECRKNMKEKTG